MRSFTPKTGWKSSGPIAWMTTSPMGSSIEPPVRVRSASATGAFGRGLRTPVMLLRAFAWAAAGIRVSTLLPRNWKLTPFVSMASATEPSAAGVWTVSLFARMPVFVISKMFMIVSRIWSNSGCDASRPFICWVMSAASTVSRKSGMLLMTGTFAAFAKLTIAWPGSSWMMASEPRSGEVRPGRTPFCVKSTGAFAW